MDSRREDRRTRSSYERELLVRYQRTRDPALREQLITRFLPLARAIAQRFAADAATREDLDQVAAIGLINALDRFDASRGAAFTTFAVPTIAGEVKRYLRDRTWSVRPPRGLQDLALRVAAARTELTEKLHRSPTATELGALIGVPADDVLEAIHAHQARSAASLQAPSSPSGADVGRLEETLGREEEAYEAAERRVLVDGLLRNVCLRDRRVLRMCFELDMTQTEIASVVGVSQMQVSRILRKALRRLHDVVGARSSPELADDPPAALTATG
jgi:RNA polymerase sigma-B factor